MPIIIALFTNFENVMNIWNCKDTVQYLYLYKTKVHSDNGCYILYLPSFYTWEQAYVQIFYFNV